MQDMHVQTNLKCHHVEQWNLPTSGWHYIWVILWESYARNCFFKVDTWDIISHKKTTVWLPVLWNDIGSGLFKHQPASEIHSTIEKVKNKQI